MYGDTVRLSSGGTYPWESSPQTPLTRMEQSTSKDEAFQWGVVRVFGMELPALEMGWAQRTVLQEV